MPTYRPTLLEALAAATVIPQPHRRPRGRGARAHPVYLGGGAGRALRPPGGRWRARRPDPAGRDPSHGLGGGSARSGRFR